MENFVSESCQYRLVGGRTPTVEEAPDVDRGMLFDFHFFFGREVLTPSR
jgi:hypothetical protein